MYNKPVCRGSWVLGTACGRCERCEDARPGKPLPVAPNPQDGGKEQGFLPESPSADAGPSPRSPEALRFGEWLPIETAPRRTEASDRVEFVLIAWTNGDGTQGVGEAYWHPEDPRDGGWWWAGTSPGDYYADDVQNSISGRITHWMPLPEPPRAGDRASSRDEGGLRDEPENPLLQATGGENGR